MSELGGRGRGSRPFSPSRWCSTVTKEGKKIEGRAINLISIILRDGQGFFFLLIGTLKSFLGKLAKFVRFTLTLNNDF